MQPSDLVTLPSGRHEAVATVVEMMDSLAAIAKDYDMPAAKDEFGKLALIVWPALRAAWDAQHNQ